MKKILIFISLLIPSTQLFSQTAADFFSATEITWYGLDYSKAKMIGSLGFTNPGEIKARYFDSWNLIVPTEPFKYNIKSAFKKKNVNYSLEMIKKRNAEKVNPQELVIDTKYSLEEKEIQNIVNEYEPDEKSGIGVVFIVESYDKYKAKAFIYVTVFDINSKKVLIVKKMEGIGQGFGLKNYWAYSTYKVIVAAKKEYKNWEKMYRK